jgi:short-subunit dehydrogenase
MEWNFRGKVAVVTGASSGIGRELARQLAQADARVGLVARRTAELDELAREIRAQGRIALPIPADVADRDQMERAIQAIRDELGPIDIMIACAGVGMPTLLDPVNVSDVEAMIRVNVLGVVYSIAAVLPEMLRRQSGRLAAVSSLSGYVSLPGESGYCASKAAVNSYLAGLRAHLRGRGVTVTTLCPGFVQTAMTESNNFWMPGLLSAEEAARRMLRAVRRGTRVYNFPWTTALLTKLVGTLPEPLVVQLMAGYNEEAASQADKGTRP